MKQLFLTSSVNFVAKDISKRINKKGLKLAFITTPTEVEESDLKWLDQDKQALIDAGFKVDDYTITGKTKEQIAIDLDKYDVISISGGNTFYLLEKIQQTNSAGIFRNLINKGKIYIGTSAGSVITAPDISPTMYLDDIQKAPNLKNYEGLGMVNFIVFPHWGSDNFKERYLTLNMQHSYTEKDNIILLNNNSYILVEDESFKIIEVK